MRGTKETDVSNQHHAFSMISIQFNMTVLDMQSSSSKKCNTPKPLLKTFFHLLVQSEHLMVNFASGFVCFVVSPST